MSEKVISVNRRARHEYEVLEVIQAGIVLDGAEVKSLRQGNVSFSDSFCLITSTNTLILKNAHIKNYDKSGAFNQKDSLRDRVLLVKKSEALKLRSKINEKGLTLVPLKFYFKGALIKLEIGVCKGKHTYDKKKSLMERDLKRKMERDLKNEIS